MSAQVSQARSAKTKAENRSQNRSSVGSRDNTRQTHRPKVSGTVYQRPNGKWAAQRYAAHLDGSTRRVTATFLTETEAWEHLAA